MQKPKPLGPKLRVQGAETRDIAAWTVEAGDKTNFDRIRPDAEDDRNGRGRGFGRKCRRRAARCGDYGHSAVYQIGGQFRQASVVIVPKAKFDRHVAALGKTGFAEALTESCYNSRAEFRRARKEKSTNRH